MTQYQHHGKPPSLPSDSLTSLARDQLLRGASKTGSKMGTFQGHVLPGVFMLLFGLRTAIGAFSSMRACMRDCSRRSQLDSPTAKSSPEDTFDTELSDECIGPRQLLRFRSQIFYGYSCCVRHNVPTDAYIFLAFVLIGFISELVPCFQDGEVGMHSLQHMLMYSFFGILGLVVVKTERVRAAAAAAAAEMDGSGSSLLPAGADYAALVLALFVEGLLFAFHLHGRGMIDVHVHQLLILAIVAGILAAVVEARMRHQPLAVLARAYSLLIQGSWFCQVSPSFLFSCLRSHYFNAVLEFSCE